MLLKDKTIHKVNGIGREQERDICKFLQGCVYCWCNNHPNQCFSARDFLGRDNCYWEETPLMPLYEKHKSKATAVKDAGKDAGWLLKKVILEDKRTFNTKTEQLIRQYKWVGNEI